MTIIMGVVGVVVGLGNIIFFGSLDSTALELQLIIWPIAYGLTNLYIGLSS